MYENVCMLRSDLFLFKEKNPELYEEFIAYLKSHTLIETADKYYNVFGKTQAQMRQNLGVWNTKYKLREEKKEVPDNFKQVKDIPPAPINPQQVVEQPDGSVLTIEEIAFLDKFKNGEITFEEIQREFAYRVLKKVLSDPRLLKASDWLKSEVIKIQREELSMKKEQMERAWGMIFGGFKFPKYCPQCGHDLQSKDTSPVDATLVSEIKGLEQHDHIEPMGSPS